LNGQDRVDRNADAVLDPGEHDGDIFGVDAKLTGFLLVRAFLEDTHHISAGRFQWRDTTPFFSLDVLRHYQENKNKERWLHHLRNAKG
jgi:hypothetical protein